MNRRILCLLLCMSLLLVAGCGQGPGSTDGEKAAEPYKIGAIVDISGPAASLGEPERDTLRMLADELNARGGIDGRPVDLIILDNKSLETEAVLAAKRLIDQGVLAIIGCSASGTSLAI
ncbi:MAG: ABC transporter substrate-binding protein, partial [Eubacteriales bacterium]|nr:ABC transporter substrate-binding protein [Eubacteriales bacterium]